MDPQEAIAVEQQQAQLTLFEAPEYMVLNIARCLATLHHPCSSCYASVNAIPSPSWVWMGICGRFAPGGWAL